MKDFLSRISSRRFIFFAIGTVFMIFSDKMTASDWLICGSVYVSLNTLEKVADAIKGKKGE